MGNFANLCSLKCLFFAWTWVLVILVRHFGVAKWSKTTGLISLHNTYDETGWEMTQEESVIIGKKRFAFPPFFSEFYDKLGEFDKNQESGRQHIKSWGLESLYRQLTFVFGWLEKLNFFHTSLMAAQVPLSSSQFFSLTAALRSEPPKFSHVYLVQFLVRLFHLLLDR